MGGTEWRPCAEAEGEAEEAQWSRKGEWIHLSAGGALKALMAVCSPCPIWCPYRLTPASYPSALYR